MKRFVLILSMLTLLYGGGVYAQDQLISLDTTFGLTIDNTVVGGSALTFIIRTTNLEDNSFNGISNGFRVYSPDGLTWTGTSANQLSSIDWATNFMIFQTVLINVDGIGADTIGFGGIGTGVPPSVGIPALFDDTTYSITIGPIITTDTVQHICLDSS